MYQHLLNTGTPGRSLDGGLVEIEFAAVAGRIWLRMRVKPNDEANEPTIGLADMLRLNMIINIPQKRVYYTATNGQRFSPITVETVAADF